MKLLTISFDVSDLSDEEIDGLAGEVSVQGEYSDLHGEVEVKSCRITPEPIEGWLPYIYNGAPYYLISWDHKAYLPTDEVTQAACLGFTHMHDVPDTHTDAIALVCSQSEDFDAQEVWDAYDSDESLWG